MSEENVFLIIPPTGGTVEFNKGQSSNMASPNPITRPRSNPSGLKPKLSPTSYTKEEIAEAVKKMNESIQRRKDEKMRDLEKQLREQLNPK